MALPVRIDGPGSIRRNPDRCRARRRAVAGLIAVLIVGACTGSSATPPAQEPSGILAGSPSPTVPGGPLGPTSASTAAPTGPVATAPGPPPSPTLAELIDQLRTSPSQSVRLAAVEALGALTDPSVGPALEAALGDQDPDVRTAAAVKLGDRGDTHAVKPLAAALTAEMRAEPMSPFVEAASVALGTLGGGGGVAALILVIRGPTGDGRKAAFVALGHVGAPAIAPLQKLLSSSDVTVRIAGVDGLFALGARGVKPLTAALQNSEAQVASHAANRLGYLHDRSAEAALVAVLTKGWWKTASIALARINETTPTRLVTYLGSKATVRVYYGLIFVGADETAGAMATSLLKVGDLEMAREFLNCGSTTLEQAAHDWADAHGYSVVTIPGSGGGTWGSGLPD